MSLRRSFFDAIGQRWTVREYGFGKWSLGIKTYPQGGLLKQFAVIAAQCLGNIAETIYKRTHFRQDQVTLVRFKCNCLAAIGCGVGFMTAGNQENRDGYGNYRAQQQRPTKFAHFLISSM